jgi:hypothetical protein
VIATFIKKKNKDYGQDEDVKGTYTFACWLEGVLLPLLQNFFQKKHDVRQISGNHS